MGSLCMCGELLIKKSDDVSDIKSFLGKLSMDSFSVKTAGPVSPRVRQINLHAPQHTNEHRDQQGIIRDDHKIHL